MRRGIQWVKARIEFVPQDAWVGAFWKRRGVTWSDFDAWGFRGQRPAVWWRLWVCVLPCLPLHFEWYTFPRGELQYPRGGVPPCQCRAIRRMYDRQEPGEGAG